MAGSSVIGALRVDLGLNSAAFTAGLKQAQTGLASFGRAAAAGLQVVSVAALAAGTAMGFAVKHAIDHADALSKSAQKAGISTEALSRLAYAASYSDVSLEGLTGGLQKLSKAMADSLITKTSTSAIAFKALGISVTDAAGNLRNSKDVFADIADKFQRLPDSATKTALAMQIFGKSGAELIPLLNGGSASLKQFADESDRLGITLSTSTGRAAEKFNDTLSYIGKVMQGVVNQVMEAALPALQSLADMLASPDFAEAAKTLSVNIISAIQSIIDLAERGLKAIKDLKTALNPDEKTIMQRYAAANGLPDPTVSTNIEDRTGAGNPLGGAAGQLRLNSTFDALGNATTFGSTKDMWAALTPPATVGPKFTAATSGLKDWNDEMDGTIKLQQELAASMRDDVTNAITGFVDAIASGTNPLKAFADELGNIGKMLLDRGIASLIGNIFTPNFLGGTVGAPALKLGFQTGIPGFADGTFSAPRGLAWVGEKGPELMNMRGGETVLPASQSAALGGPHISISISGSKNDAAAIARQVSKTLPDAIAAYNRNPLRRS